MKTGYSAAATLVAKLFVERTDHGLFADPHLNIEQVVRETGLSEEDVRDGLHELSPFITVSAWDDVRVKENLFSAFDEYWKPWIPADDALRIAAGLVNDGAFPSGACQIAALYGWDARRINPAIMYLVERRLIREDRTIGSAPFVMRSINPTDNLRRFVKSRS